jgi:hypothetical protein
MIYIMKIKTVTIVRGINAYIIAITWGKNIDLSQISNGINYFGKLSIFDNEK